MLNRLKKNIPSLLGKKKATQWMAKKKMLLSFSEIYLHR
jgi:hypothetical protein